MKTLKPLGNRIVVAPLKPITQTAGGIFVAPRYQDDERRYRVLLVGPGRRTKKGVLVAPEVKPGDEILARADYGSQHEWTDGVKVINAAQVVAVIER